MVHNGEERNCSMGSSTQPFLLPTQFICPRPRSFQSETNTPELYHIPTIFNGKRRVQRYVQCPHAASCCLLISVCVRKTEVEEKSTPKQKQDKMKLYCLLARPAYSFLRLHVSVHYTQYKILNTIHLWCWYMILLMLSIRVLLW